MTDLVREAGLDRPVGARRLDESGRQAVVITADRVAGLVDELLAGQWSRRSGSFVEAVPSATPDAAPQAGCACASAIPVQTVDVDGQAVPLAALPLIFEHFRGAGKAPGPAVTQELLETVRIYNQVPAGMETALAAALEREYAAFCGPVESRS